jgi:hypothetical protein
MNSVELKKLKLSDNEILIRAEREGGYTFSSEARQLCIQIGYILAFKQIETAMIAEDEEMGAALNPEKEE